MSWAENEKLNEWIERAYENGRNEERKVILEFLNSELHGECSCDQSCKCSRCSVIVELLNLIEIGAE